jgi:hypothetical protein
MYSRHCFLLHLPVYETENQASLSTFWENEGVIEAANEFFENQNREFFFEGLNKLEYRWAECIDVEGDYIKK